jgi:8-oxo-dGTP pyrophosphatase MutT (NUDIX family)
MKTTVGLLLIDKYEHILACHPTRHGALQWDIVKGCIDPGETPEETIRREFEEETSIPFDELNGTFVDFTKLYNTDYVYVHKKKVLHGCVFRLEDTIEITKFKCNSMVTNYKCGNKILEPFPEIDAFSWITYKEIDILHETQQRFINDVKNCYDIFNKNSLYENAQLVNSIKSNTYG